MGGHGPWDDLLGLRQSNVRTPICLLTCPLSWQEALPLEIKLPP